MDDPFKELARRDAKAIRGGMALAAIALVIGVIGLFTGPIVGLRGGARGRARAAQRPLRLARRATPDGRAPARARPRRARRASRWRWAGMRVFGGVGCDRRARCRRPHSRRSSLGMTIAARADLTPMATIVFFPEGAHGPTNNCAGIGAVLRERGHRVVFILEESFAGTLEARGFEERLMRLGPPPEQEEAPGPVLDRLHPRHGAGLPQADDRAARRVRRADLRGALRRRALRPRAAARDHRRAAARRHRRGQRRVVPGARGERRPLGAHRLVQSARGAGSGAPARVLRLSRRPTARSGQRSRRSSGARTPTCTRRSTSSAASAERRRSRGSSSWTPRRSSTSTAIPTRPTTRARGRSARRGTTCRRACARASRGSCPTHLRDGPGALLYLSLGSLGSADVELMQRLVDILGATRAPRDRLQGPAGRPDPAARQHVRRGLPAAAGDPAAGRPRDHPRRQQHDLRGAPPRQADGRAADLLGSVRQRPARARDRSRRAPRDLRVRGRGAHRRGRPPARRRGAARAPRGHGASGCRRRPAPSRRPA